MSSERVKGRLVLVLAIVTPIVVVAAFAYWLWFGLLSGT